MTNPETATASPPIATPEKKPPAVHTRKVHRQPNIRRYSLAYFSAGALLTAGIGGVIYEAKIKPTNQAAVAAAKKQAVMQRNAATALGNESIRNVAASTWGFRDGFVTVDISSNPNHPNNGCSRGFYVVHEMGKTTLSISGADPISHNTLQDETEVVTGHETDQKLVKELREEWDAPKHDDCQTITPLPRGS